MTGAQPVRGTQAQPPGPVVKEAGAWRPPRESANWVALLLYVYIWFLVATPYVRFQIFTTVRFERLLVAACWIVAFFGGYAVLRMTRTTWLFVLFFAWMLLGWFFSPHRDASLVQSWIENYWKLVLLQLLIVFCLVTLKDISYGFFAVAVVSGLYQMHTWWDFLHGGAYVYRMGIKRIIGVWSEGGSGGGNAFGIMALIALPFTEYCLKRVRKPGTKMFFRFLLVICLSSIVFSGTRAALISALLFGLLHLTSFKAQVRAVAALIVLAFLFSTLPPKLQNRYSTILGDDDLESASVDEAASKRSGQTRIEGLRDGFKLAQSRPVLGFGPGASMYARFEINPTPFWEGKVMYLQLHSLYGQLLAETGFLGTLIFGLLMLSFLGELRTARRRAATCPDLDWRTNAEQVALTLRNVLILMVFYGLFAHTLFRYQWMFVLGFHGAFVALMSRVSHEWKREPRNA